MSDSIIVALIAGGFALIGNVLSNKSTENKIQQQMVTNQAVNETKMEELTREVREHNGFARRMPVLEEQIKVINHRIEDLERIHEKP